MGTLELEQASCYKDGDFIKYRDLGFSQCKQIASAFVHSQKHRGLLYSCKEVDKIFNATHAKFTIKNGFFNLVENEELKIQLTQAVKIIY